MEAFILTDKVITRQHMERQGSKPKYLKRYDVSPHTSKRNKRVFADRKPLTPVSFINAPRTKDLLNQISMPVDTTNQGLSSSSKLNRSFMTSSDNFRQTQKRTKVRLLIRTIQPHSQHYDAQFASISKRAPCWVILPEKKRQQALLPKQAKQVSKKENKKVKKRPSKPRPFEFGDFLQKQQQKVSFQAKGRNEVDSRLQYSTGDLGKNTIKIYKKYKLDKDPFFKRMLAGLQQ